jgi:hypothetical protein
VKLLNSKFKVKIYIILVFPSSAVLKPAQAGLVYNITKQNSLKTLKKTKEDIKLSEVTKVRHCIQDLIPLFIPIFACFTR